MRSKKKRFVIAIDGPAGSGKSTVSKLIAKRLGEVRNAKWLNGESVINYEFEPITTKMTGPGGIKMILQLIKGRAGYQKAKGAQHLIDHLGVPHQSTSGARPCPFCTMLSKQIMFSVTIEGSEYYVVANINPWSKDGILLVSKNVSEQAMTEERLRHSIIFARALGTERETLFNTVGASVLHFHDQAFTGNAVIWENLNEGRVNVEYTKTSPEVSEGIIRGWPAVNYYIEGTDIEKVAQAAWNIVSGLINGNLLYDIDIRTDDGKTKVIIYQVTDAYKMDIGGAYIMSGHDVKLVEDDYNRAKASLDASARRFAASIKAGSSSTRVPRTLVIAGVIAAVIAGLALIAYYFAPNIIGLVQVNKEGITRLGSMLTVAGFAGFGAVISRKIIRFSDLSRKGRRKVLGIEAPQSAESSEEMTALERILAEFPGIENNIDKLRLAMARALKQPEFIVGISRNASGEIEETLRSSLVSSGKIGAQIVRIENAAALEKMTRRNRIPAILIDESVTLAEISKPEFKDSITLLASNLNEFTIRDMTKRELQLLLWRINGNLEKIKRANINNDMAAVLKLRENNVPLVEALKGKIAQRKKALAAIFNNEKIPAKFYGRRTAIATTERVAPYDMYAFDNMKAAEDQLIANYFVYGDIYETEDAARQFVRACGYTGNIDEIKFIDKRGLTYAALVSAIQDIERSLGRGKVHIGIRATAEDKLLRENEKVEAGTTYLEVQPVEIEGKPVYAAFNSYQVLLKIMAELEREGMTLEKITIPGVSIDSAKGILRYLPHILPIDYGKEIDIYQRAIEAIRTSM